MAEDRGQAQVVFFQSSLPKCVGAQPATLPKAQGDANRTQQPEGSITPEPYSATLRQRKKMEILFRKFPSKQNEVKVFILRVS